MVVMKGNWKSEPDEYFGWALSVTALSAGHMLVDFVPEDGTVRKLNTEEKHLLGITFEGAIRYCLDSTNVTRLACSPHCMPEHLYHAVARPMRKLMSKPTSVLSSGDGFENASFNQPKNSRRRHLNMNLNNNASKVKNQKFESEKLQRLQEERARENELKLPYVLVVQDVDLLPRKTQIALLEMMVTRVMPVKLVKMTSGSDPLPVPGLTELPVRFMVIALSSSVPEHSIEYDAIDNNSDKRVSLLPALFDEFLLRVPLKLPPRKHLINILRQKVLPNATQRTHSPGHLELLKEDTDVENNTGDEDDAWTQSARYCLLWPSALKVKSNTWKDSAMDELRAREHFESATRLQKSELESMTSSVLRVHVSLAIKQHVRDIITALRSHRLIAKGPNTQSQNAMEHAIRAVALNQNLNFVTPYHVMSIVVEVFAHRIVLRSTPGPEKLIDQREGQEAKEFYPPKHWHAVTAARLIVAQVYEHCVAVQR